MMARSTTPAPTPMPTSAAMLRPLDEPVVGIADHFAGDTPLNVSVDVLSLSSHP